MVWFLRENTKAVHHVWYGSQGQVTIPNESLSGVGYILKDSVFNQETKKRYVHVREERLPTTYVHLSTNRRLRVVF